MNEEFPAESPEITIEQATEFADKIKSLQPSLEKIPVEQYGGSELYGGIFMLGDSKVEVRVSDHPEETVEGGMLLPGMQQYAVVVTTQDNKGKIAARTEDEYSVQYTDMGDASLHKQRIFVRDGFDASFKEVGGDSKVLRELIEEYGEGNVEDAARAFVRVLTENLALNAAVGKHSMRFTQEDFREVMSILEQIG